MGLLIQADLDEQNDQIIFDLLSTKGDKVELPGRSPAALAIRLGSRTLKDLVDEHKATIDGAKIRVPARHVAALGEFSLALDAGAAPDGGEVAAAGRFVEITTLTDKRDFYDKIQMASTRIKGDNLIKIGCRANFENYEDVPTRAAVVTVFGHRLVEDMVRNKARPDPNDLAWFRRASRDMLSAPVVDHLRKPDVGWDTVRWLLSLSTVAGNIAIATDEIDTAISVLEHPCAFSHLVVRSRVSALNIVNAFLLRGMLLADAGRMEEAGRHFRSCLEIYPTVASSQHMLENVWVIGDLINSARASRQAFILLATLGLADRPASAIIDPKSKFDLGQVQSPLGQLIQAGHCETFKAIIGRLNDAA